jgi:death-on-curing protein
MSDPIFLEPELVEEYHKRSLELFGGLDGLRDRGLFIGAVMQAQNVYWYGKGDLFDIAAAYCFYIAQAQAFLDGNKRTAVAAGLAFLEFNGMDTDRDIDEELFDAMIALANHEMTREQLAMLLRDLFT